MSKNSSIMLVIEDEFSKIKYPLILSKQKKLVLLVLLLQLLLCWTTTTSPYKNVYQSSSSFTECNTMCSQQDLFISK